MTDDPEGQQQDTGPLIPTQPSERTPTAPDGRRASRPATGWAGVRPDVRGGTVIALLSATAFGTVAPLAKLAYERGAEPLALLSLRFVLAALLLFGLDRALGRASRLPAAVAVRLMLLGGIAYAGETWLFFAALEVSPASVVSLVFYSFPLITAIISFLLRLERVQLRSVVALLLGSAGVISIFGVAGTDARGPLLALGAALAVAIYFILAGVLVRDVPPSVAAAWTAAGAAVALTIAALTTGSSLPAASVPAGVALGVVTVVAFAALYRAISRMGSARTAIVQMFEPLVTVLLAWSFLGEAITGRVALGAALIISALPVLSTRGRRVTPPAPDSL